MSLSFGVIDVLIVAVVVLSAAYAAWRGFLWETLTIFEWIAAAFACLYLGPVFTPMTHSLVGEAWLAALLAYAGVFLAVFIPLAFISHRLSEGVRGSPIGPLDRAAGVAFGIVRGMVVVAIAYLVFTYFVPIPRQPGWVTQARLLPEVQSTAEALLTLIPHHNGAHMAGMHPASAPIRQAPPTGETGHNDPLAGIIRRNDATETSTVRPVRQQDGPKDAKGYGIRDRQALDKLIEATGNGK